jgi:adenylate cyclase
MGGRAIAYGTPPTRANYAEAISWFERALAIDPRSVEALSLLANWLAGRVLDNMSDSALADIARAETLAEQALGLSPRSALAHFAKGNVLRAQNLFQEAITSYETVLALNRNWVTAIAALGWCQFLAGSIDEAIPAQERAICLSPRDHNIGNWYSRMGIIHLLQSRTDKAIVWLEKARRTNLQHPSPHACLASAYGLKGETERAAAELAEARMLSDGRYSSIARLKAAQYFGVPKVRALYEATYFAGLRKAGMPEE